jgi:hypothetical protein
VGTTGSARTGAAMLGLISLAGCAVSVNVSHGGANGPTVSSSSVNPSHLVNSTGYGLRGTDIANRLGCTFEADPASTARVLPVLDQGSCQLAAIGRLALLTFVSEAQQAGSEASLRQHAQASWKAGVYAYAEGTGWIAIGSKYSASVAREVVASQPGAQLIRIVVTAHSA